MGRFTGKVGFVTSSRGERCRHWWRWQRPQRPGRDFERIIQTNLTGAYRCVRAESKLLNASGGGSIVSISSIAGSHTHHLRTAYCVSKAGLTMLTRCAADDLGAHNIRVNAVAPGTERIV